MSNLLIVNVLSWSTEQVINWLKGLDDTIQLYFENFVKGGITGKKLLLLDHQDLDKLSVKKLGHQELFLEAINLLSHLQYSLENETIQSIALKLSCQATCVYNDTKQHQKHESTDRLPITVLSGIIKVVGYTKVLVSWLDRAPFNGSDDYIRKRNQLVDLSTSLINSVQCDDSDPSDSVFDSTEDLKSHCQTISDLCEKLIQNSRDTLTIQPAWLEIAVIRKKPEEELGMHIQSSYSGTHTIGGIKEKSPAHLCGKIEEGDEVVMVNGQVVIGWQLKKLVNTLKANKKEISLTLKKRPCHADPFGHKGHRKKRGNKLQPVAGTFPRRQTSRKSKKSRVPLTLISTTPEQTSENFNGSVKEVESENDTLDDNDNVFISGSDSPGFQNKLTTFDDKVKQRRATVSGGSPTVKRPSIMISDSDSAPRPKSYTLALSSAGSEDYSSFEVSSCDFGSPASERTSPPTDSSDAGYGLHGNKAVLSPPPIINVSGAGTNVRESDSGVGCECSEATGEGRRQVGVEASGDVSASKDKARVDSVVSGNRSQETSSVVISKDSNQQSAISATVTAISTNIPPSNSREPITPTNQTPEKSAPNNTTETDPASINQNIVTITTDYTTETILTSPNQNAVTITTSPSSINRNSEAGRKSVSGSVTSSVVQDSNVELGGELKTGSLASVKHQGGNNGSGYSSSSVGSSSSNSSGAHPKLHHNSPGGSLGEQSSPKMSRLTANVTTPYRKKSSDQAMKTIAGGVEDLKSPTLLSVKRIDSLYRAEMAEQERRQRGEVSGQDSNRLTTLSSDDRPQSVVASYSVNIVGGVPQIMKTPNPNMPKKKKVPTATLR